MPVDYSKYPLDWKTRIRPEILARDGHACKFCRVANGAWLEAKCCAWPSFRCLDWSKCKCGKRRPRVVLTVAHLDRNVENNDYQNLAALCQRCHLRHDAKQHAKNAAATRRRKALENQPELNL